ncbi:hypothetical protein NDU88_001149 [Pleurodeles waltl]|uniref:Uncharacterized protein n=1 Tax=Pleurodeles waltl TaxID=8319 RepID=A0AAV7SAT9_PLEWA|nr:hypothetical protein NDU88_001149 [Pleurodeles waltl]
MAISGVQVQRRSRDSRCSAARIQTLRPLSAKIHIALPDFGFQASLHRARGFVPDKGAEAPGNVAPGPPPPSACEQRSHHWGAHPGAGAHEVM